MAKYRVPVLDSFSWQEPVISKTIRDVQISPIRGHRYIVPTGIIDVNNPWLNQENKIAWYDGCEWKYDIPIDGWYVYIQDESKLYKYDGENWISEDSISVVTVELYVDGNRTDEYVETGSIIKPYKTIQSAITHIINAEDNAVQKGYIINVVPALYVEDLDFNNEYLINIEINGLGNQSTFLKSITSIQDIKCDNLLHFIIKNFTFLSDVHFEGLLDNTQFGLFGFEIRDSYFDQFNLTLRNINNVVLSNIKSNSIITWSNINNGRISGEQNIAKLIIEVDIYSNKPEMWSSEINIGTNIQLLQQQIKDVQFDSISGNIFVSLKNGAIISSSLEILPSNVTVYAYNSILLGNWTLHLDSNLTLYNSFVTGILTELTGSILNISNQQSSQLVIGHTQNVNLNDGLLEINENSKVSSVIDKINEVLKCLAPSEADSLNDIELECSCLKYTGKLSAGLSNNWYQNGQIPGSIIDNIITTNQFTIYTGVGEPDQFDHDKQPINTNSARFRKGDKGLLKVIYNDTTVAILDITENFIIPDSLNNSQPIQDLSLWNKSGRGNECNHAVVDFSNNRGSLEITDVRQFRLCLFYKMNAKLDIINLNPGFNSIYIIHDDIDPIEISKKFNITHDNNTSSLSFLQIPNIQEFELSSSKYISGIRYYSTGDKFLISFIGLNLFRNCYCIDKVAEYEFDGLSIIQSKTPIQIPNFDDQLLVEDIIRIDKVDFYSVNSRVVASLYHPFKTTNSYVSRADNRLICTYNIKSTSTIEYFVDEFWRLPIGEYDVLPVNLTNNWDSTRLLSNGNVLVYNCEIKFPNINLEDSFPINNPDYSRFSGSQLYLRSFYSQNPHSNVNITLPGLSNSDIGSTLDENVNINIKLPGLTGWLDISKFFNVSDFNGIDGDGCLISQSESTWNITFGSFSTVYSGGVIIIRIRFNNTNCSITSGMSVNW